MGTGKIVEGEVVAKYLADFDDVFVAGSFAAGSDLGNVRVVLVGQIGWLYLLEELRELFTLSCFGAQLDSTFSHGGSEEIRDVLARGAEFTGL